MLVLVLVMLWTMLLFDRMSWAVPLLSFTTDTSTVIQYLFVLCPFKQSPFVLHPLNFRYHPSSSPIPIRSTFAITHHSTTLPLVNHYHVKNSLPHIAIPFIIIPLNSFLPTSSTMAPLTTPLSVTLLRPTLPQCEILTRTMTVVAADRLPSSTIVAIRSPMLALWLFFWRVLTVAFAVVVMVWGLLLLGRAWVRRRCRRVRRDLF